LVSLLVYHSLTENLPVCNEEGPEGLFCQTIATKSVWANDSRRYLRVKGN
jgi:hypothetical protein